MTDSDSTTGGSDRCANCGSPNPSFTATTTKTILEIGRFQFCWIRGRSHYCSVGCYDKYHNKDTDHD